ncbi:MAG: SDR family NAD(P)-dependent oxidoreductase [Betaproteobacteria bacterium]|nr:SDR family NAD(P)-dependent oxidoreductase [Betaproteobacteria bacterium]
MRILVTGSARGLGLGICTAAAKRGDEVIAACRKSTAELRALAVRVVEGIDVAEESSLQRLRDALGAEPLDTVVCNAGINVSCSSRSIDELDLGALAKEYGVNAVGTARTVQAVLPNLGKGSKVILITTSGETLRRNPSRGGSYGYRMSKAGINQFGFLLASEIRPRGIAVRIISPGPVDTDMTRIIGGAGVVLARAPGQMPDIVTAGRKVLGQIDELTLEDTGSWIDQADKRWA